MSTKLTLRLDESLIDNAKRYALAQDRSLSRLVADYFSRLTPGKDATGKTKTSGLQTDSKLGPITTGLRGALRRPAGKTAAKPVKTRADYHVYLDEKYL